MRKLVLMLLAALYLCAEPTFEQVQTMIDKQEYKQAKLALTIITQNHPDSSKAYYTLAQANAGLGDLISARKALDKAQALNPTLSFVPQSQVEKLKQAIQPQTTLITKVEEPSHWFRNLLIAIALGILAFFGYKRFNKPKPKVEEPKPSPKYEAPKYTYKEPTKNAREQETRQDSVPTPPHADRFNHPTHTEAHHHHYNNSGSSTLETITVAGLTSAAVTSMMNHNNEHPHSHTYVDHSRVEPAFNNSPVSTWEEPKSSTWDEEPEISKSWDEPTPSRSNSWDDSSSSSSNDSWSSSSSSSSSSWGD